MHSLNLSALFKSRKNAQSRFKRKIVVYGFRIIHESTFWNCIGFCNQTVAYLRGEGVLGVEPNPELALLSPSAYVLTLVMMGGGGGLIVPQFFFIYFFTKNLSPRPNP